ncbi:MAG: hypothetical protein ACE5KE_00720, partial [Methanosarcinales archaeon]
ISIVLLSFIIAISGIAIVSAQTNDPSTCDDAGCHAGIESINPKMPFTCTTCHSGNGNATTKEEAHSGEFYPNPSAMEVLAKGKGCAQCHSTNGSIMKLSDHTERVMKSIMTTFAGVISGARYENNAQDTKNSLYAAVAVNDTDGEFPVERGALKKLDQIPEYNRGISNGTGEPIDGYLRKECLRCHLWNEGAKRFGDYRSSGCAACHVVYANDGLYRGNDTTIPKNETDHPIKHEITTKIPSYQCVHCHDRGNRIGVSYLGLMEQDPYGSPWTEEGELQGKVHGKWYHKIRADIHYERGMECIDCHTSQDMHGDGNLYSKKEQYVEIECEDCHGTPDKYPWDADGKVRTSGAKLANGTPYGVLGGNIITNLEKRGEELYLISKFDGKEHQVPLLKKIKEENKWRSIEANVSMDAIPKHLEKMECYACHAKWVPQCYGCHVRLDDRKTEFDWVSKNETPGKITEKRSYLRWENPVLGINAEGKVAPYMPGCQVTWTLIASNGTVLAFTQPIITSEGKLGISQNPAQSHTTTVNARKCMDCHGANPKVLGLGTGLFTGAPNTSDDTAKTNAYPIGSKPWKVLKEEVSPGPIKELPNDFEWERIVDEEGNQIQDTSHYGARPFNKTEMDRIRRVGTCIGCHQNYSDSVWQEVRKNVGIVQNPEEHSKVLNKAIHGVIGDFNQNGRVDIGDAAKIAYYLVDKINSLW